MKKDPFFSDNILKNLDINYQEGEKMDPVKLKSLYDLYWKLQSQYHCAIPCNKKLVRENILKVRKILSGHMNDVYSLLESKKI